MQQVKIGKKKLQTANCEPTLNDTQVLEFCKQGYLVYEGVVPNEINRRVSEFIEKHGQEPLRQEDWFIENVLLNPQAAGAVRSLLGEDFGFPVGVANHRLQCPAPAQGWHRDGGSRYGSETNHLQVFYYPQDTPVELGPTEIVPGSHFLFCLQSWMGHYGNIRSGLRMASPAGTIFITAYPIWHRRSESTAHGLRNMLKYCYWRTVPPQRDWIAEPDFDFAMAQYSFGGIPRQQFRDWYDAAAMFCWLCGDMSILQDLLGGADWPMGYPPPRPGAQIYPPQGFYRFPISPIPNKGTN
jgi:hypothetical protein